MKTTILAISKYVVCLLMCLALSACFVRPYKFDLEQGNVFTVDKIDQIQPGMSEEQVRYVLGTPMLHDVFHTNRWDYIYIDKPNNGKEIRQHVAIYFDNGRVDRVTRDALPSAVA
jgi:outer membrane protein assembly factor BamE